MRNLDSVLKNRRTTLPTKVHIVKDMISPEAMHGCELEHNKGWALKNWCFRIVDLEKTLESPLDFKEIELADPKEINPEYSLGGLTLKPKLILCPPDGKSWLVGKDPDAGKDWRQKEKRTTGGEMLRWLHRLNAQEFEQTLEDSEGQGSLACCSLWGHKESDTTYQLNSNEEKESGTKQFSKDEYQFFIDSFKK